MSSPSNATSLSAAEQTRSARIGGVRIEGSTAHTANGTLTFSGGQTFV